MNLKRPLFSYVLCTVIGATVAVILMLLVGNKDVKFAKMSQVFSESEIKKVYEEELKAFEVESNSKLEELQREIKRREVNGEPAEVVNPLKAELQGRQAQLTEQYNEKSDSFQTSIWTELNKRIEQYGKEMGYTYILGANGDGSIMYGNEAEDITEELIKYINK